MEWKSVEKDGLPIGEDNFKQIQVIFYNPIWATWFKGMFSYFKLPELTWTWSEYDHQSDRYCEVYSSSCPMSARKPTHYIIIEDLPDGQQESAKFREELRTYVAESNKERVIDNGVRSDGDSSY